MDEVFDIRKGGVTVDCELSPQFATIRATVYLKQMEPKKVNMQPAACNTHRTQHTMQGAEYNMQRDTTRSMVH